MVIRELADSLGIKCELWDGTEGWHWKLIPEMHTIKGYLQHIQKVMVDLFILLIIFCIPLELLCLITHAGR
jgi:hypothetical protein